LPLAACYADVWNGVQITPARFKQLNAGLDRLMQGSGRPPESLKRTAAVFLYFGENDAALEARVQPLRVRHAELASMPLPDLLRLLSQENGAVTGTPGQVIPQIRAFEQAGVQELMLQIFDSDDLPGLNAFSRHVLRELN
jgi:alkanesulfonate monooxygenase SsuD/methylene tetrahydromethanopterin reductase-like flavin-dependent oxidoreductase (luciferase family)